MKVGRRFNSIVVTVGTVAMALSLASTSVARTPGRDATAISSTDEILSAERASKGRLLAVGRLDSISKANSSASVLSQDFALLATAANDRFVSKAEVGQPVALVGVIVEGNYLVESAIVLDGIYVPGASKVFLRGQISKVNHALALAAIGNQRIDASSFVSASRLEAAAQKRVSGVVGSQPNVAGSITAEALLSQPTSGGSRTDASVGTGRPDASVGTGRPDASVGTGRPDAISRISSSAASVGTGRPDASVGTGRPDASVGTGRPDAFARISISAASVGTGRPDASVGTGRPDASVGTGRPAQ